MDIETSRARRAARSRELRRRRRRGAAVLAVVALFMAFVVANLVGAFNSSPSSTGSHSGSSGHSRRLADRSPRGRRGRGRRGRGRGGRSPSRAKAARGTGRPGHRAVPILMYHVINPPPANAPYPGLYVSKPEFAAQMQALASAGWHAVTLDEVEANWTRGVPLPAKAIVLSFDNGYQSQYTNALPVLRRYGWVGNENIQLTGLPPSQGGLSEAQVRGLIKAGWELDTQGQSHAELPTLDAAELRYQIAEARETLRRRYGVPVNWFCYPSGHYDAAVVEAVEKAGFVGSTTVIAGWASPSESRFRLHRLRVLGGTSPSALLELIEGSRGDAAAPSEYVA